MSEKTENVSSDTQAAAAEKAVERRERIDAVYTLESAARCPHCGDLITTIKAIRLLRSHVNFTSTLPRRGRVLVCPECHTLLPAELTNI